VAEGVDCLARSGPDQDTLSEMQSGRSAEAESRAFIGSYVPLVRQALCCHINTDAHS